MAADLAWNLESIPEKAREQALRSARREGIPVGEWMTRQIFEGLADYRRQTENPSWFDHRQNRRGAHPERTEEPEHSSDAMHRLQQDIARLGREIDDTVRRSDAHISSLADGLEELTRDLARLRAEASDISSGLEERLTHTAGQLMVQLSGFTSRLESLAAESRNEQVRASGAAKAVEHRLTHAEQAVQTLSAHRDDTARTIAAALETLARQFESAKDLTIRLDQRLGVVEHGLDWLGTVHKNEVQELSHRLSAVDGRFEDLNQGTQDNASRLDERLAGLQAELNGLTARQQQESQSGSDALEALGARLEQLRATTDDGSRAVEAQFAEVLRSLSLLSFRQEQSAKDADAKIVHLEADVSGKLESTVRLLTLQQQTAMGALTGRHGDLENRLDAGLEELKRQAAQSEELHRTLHNALEAQVAELGERQTQDGRSVADQIADLLAHFAELQRTTSDADHGANQRIETLQQSVARQQTHGQELADEIKRLAGRIASSDERLAESNATHAQASAELHSKMEALAHTSAIAQAGRIERMKALFESVAELKGQHAETYRSIADISGRLDELHRSTTDAAQSADQDIENLRRMADELEQRHSERSEMLARDLQDLINRLESSEQRFVSKDRHGELAAKLSAKLDALENRAETTDGNIADINRAHAETHGSVADEIAALNTRLDDLQRSTSDVSETAHRDIEDLRRLAEDLERRNTDRDRAHACDVQELAARLASLDERFVDKARHGEFAAELAGKLDALEHLAKTVDGNIADINRAHDDASRSVADGIAALNSRLDELASGASETAHRHIEDLRRFAEDMERHHSDRDQAHARDIQELVDRLASLEERFVDNARYREFAAEFADKLDALERAVKTIHGNLADANRAVAETDDAIADRIAGFTARIEDLQRSTAQATATLQQRLESFEQHGRDDIAELQRDIAAKLADLEPSLAHLQHGIQQSDLRHETQERLLGDKLDELGSKLTQVESGFERRLRVMQEELGSWHDSHTAPAPTLQQHEELEAGPAEFTGAAAQPPGEAAAPVETAATVEPIEQLLPPPLPAQFATDFASDDIEWNAELDSGQPVECARATTAESEAIADDGASNPFADGTHPLDTAVSETAVLQLDNLDHQHEVIAPAHDVPPELPPFPELAAVAVESEQDALHDGDFRAVPEHADDDERAAPHDQQPADDHPAAVLSGPVDAAVSTPAPNFISQARQAAQAAAQDSELSVGKVVQKTRLSVIAAVAVVVLSVAGARLWLARTSTPAPRLPATGNMHVAAETHHAGSVASRLVIAQANHAVSTDPLLSRAESGDVHAQQILGVRDFEAAPSPQSDRDAFTWLSRAAKQGDHVAQCYLAMLYQKGRGVAADARQAFNLYSASASAGNPLAMNNLAVAYAQGTGVNKDVRQAALWFSEAADRGLVEAQFDLAVLYERGLGVPQSLSDAYRWYTIAARAGDSESKARAEAIATELSPAERDAADQDAAQFKALSAPKNANAMPREND